MTGLKRGDIVLVLFPHSDLVTLNGLCAPGVGSSPRIGGPRSFLPFQISCDLGELRESGF
jgi:hypothetical protein